MTSLSYLRCLVGAALPLVAITPAYALNIILTNDDSWSTHNIQTLKDKLEEAGHQVVMSAPCIQQSGKGGAFSLYRPMPVDESKSEDNEYCVGDSDTTKSHESFVEGTPVMAAFYGIEIGRAHV